MKVYAVALSALFILSGCKTTEPMYFYGDYPKAVYGYFKADDISIPEQIMMIEQVIEQARGAGKPVAPGVHAHLGMLYFEDGNAEQGRIQLEQEKALFPESAVYMDFLLNNSAKEEI